MRAANIAVFQPAGFYSIIGTYNLLYVIYEYDIIEKKNRK